VVDYFPYLVKMPVIMYGVETKIIFVKNCALFGGMVLSKIFVFSQEKPCVKSPLFSACFLPYFYF